MAGVCTCIQGDSWWKVSAHGGEPVPVTQHGGAHAKESADGRFLFYLKADAPVASLWKVPASGGEEKQVLPAYAAQRSMWRRMGSTSFQPMRRHFSFLIFETAVSLRSSRCRSFSPTVYP